MITFDKIVKKLLRNVWDIVSIVDIGLIIDPDYDKWSTKFSTQIYKTIYRLKSSWFLVTIKNGLFIISSWDEKINFDDYYWQIVHKLIYNECWNMYVLSGIKSLELLSKDLSAHNQLIVYTKNVSRILHFGNYSIHLKPFISNANNKKLSFQNFIDTYSFKIMIDWVKINISNKELSLLDSLYSRSWDSFYVVKKFLLNNHKSISRQLLWNLVKFKYITSINKLKQISKDLNFNDLYSICLDIIKIEWAHCFIAKKRL